MPGSAFGAAFGAAFGGNSRRQSRDRTGASRLLPSRQAGISDGFPIAVKRISLKARDSRDAPPQTRPDRRPDKKSLNKQIPINKKVAIADAVQLLWVEDAKLEK